MSIDCGTCAARDLACADCVVSVLLGAPGEGVADGPAVPVPLGLPRPAEIASAGPAPGRVELEEPEWQALAALAGSGLVPPLRLVPGGPAATTYPRGVSDGREAAG